MSKKVSEFERYERMKKLEKEAEVEKRKSEGSSLKRKSGRMKQVVGSSKGGFKDFDDEEYFGY